jgi:hypothetical protein
MPTTVPSLGETVLIGDDPHLLVTLEDDARSRKSVEAMIEFLDAELRIFVGFRKQRIQERRRT